MSKRRSVRVRKRISKSALKVIGIAVLAMVAGLSALGLERYGAIASEVLPAFNLSAKDFSAKDLSAESLSTEVERDASVMPHVHHFAMAVVGGRSTLPELAQYQLVEMELLAKGGEPSVVLRLQRTGREQPVQEYERAVSEAYFSDVWRRLQDLEVAQLTNLSPYTEQITTYKTVSRRLVSATYRFQFKDGLYDYPNSFEVHAPEQLEDTRYRDVRDLSFVVLSQNFGDLFGQ